MKSAWHAYFLSEQSLKQISVFQRLMLLQQIEDTVETLQDVLCIRVVSFFEQDRQIHSVAGHFKNLSPLQILHSPSNKLISELERSDGISETIRHPRNVV